jgi:UDP-N-acetylmuramoyl-L-alanyl-D-glutamate--2,6-diaminopimelate ligase
MLLSDVVAGLAEKRLIGRDDIDITSIQYDSRKVTPGALFIAVKGGTFDGHKFLKDVFSRGAVAAVVEEEPAEQFLDRTLVLVPDSRRAMASLAARFFDYPSRKLTVVGVTGTNGKTTVTHLVRSIFQAAGKRAGLIGTLGAKINGEHLPTEHTTPESVDLQEVIHTMVERGAEAISMELSSHGLYQGRTDMIDFDCAIFTNLTQDHLDFHGTFDAYLDAKLILFRDYPKTSKKPFLAVVNIDDPAGEKVKAATCGRVITYGVNNPADLRATDVDVTPEGVSFVMHYENLSLPVKLSVGGFFNVNNALGAAGAALGLGMDPEVVVRGLAEVPNVAGRFEAVNAGQDFSVLVDYAHTPDGLENVLRSAKSLTKNRLIVVFGCGGNRDRGKRPIMGSIATRMGDIAVVTSDNPRKEDPLAIIDEILTGIPEDCRDKVVVEPDRYSAIKKAIEMASTGDVVVVAGKGHEDYQIFADKTIHFDDREVVREILTDGRESSNS